MYKVHYSQRTPHERQTAREARKQSAGISNREGGMSYFTQGHGGAQTEQEQRDAVQFAHGAELNERTVVRFGPDLSRMIEDV